MQINDLEIIYLFINTHHPEVPLYDLISEFENARNHSETRNSWRIYFSTRNNKLKLTPPSLIYEYRILIYFYIV